MGWFSQNWIWIALAIGALWLYSRGRHGGLLGGCSLHQTASDDPAGQSKAQGADTTPTPVEQGQDGRAAEPPASSHRHGRGGCC